MGDLLNPEPKPLGSCDKRDCHDAGDYHRGGFRYCVRHYREIVEEDWEQARKEAREKRRPRSDAAKEMRDLFDEITRGVKAQESDQ